MTRDSVKTKTKVVFVERRRSEFVSLENVFASVASGMDLERFEISFVKLKYGNGLVGTLLNLLWFRPPPADIYHITGHVHYIALRLPPAKTVLTIHDLGILKHRGGLRKWLLTRLLVIWPVRRLKFVTAISAQTKKEIEDFACASEPLVRIIENPVQAHFLAGAPLKPIDPRPVLLQIGTMPNKNLPTIIRAIAGLDVRLRIIGRIDQTQENDLNQHEIEWSAVSGLSDEAIRDEYAHADVVVFCSLYEGFGLPIIEAQAMSRPVVTSDISPMREVAGNGGAALVDPENAEEIRAAVARIIDDSDYRRELCEGGLRNVARFTPQRIAASYAEVYEELRKRNFINDLHDAS